MRTIIKFKRVQKDEFNEFIKKYPRELVRDVYAVCEPPIVTYNDFERSDHWPDSVVAKTYLYDDYPGGYYYEPEDQREYYIMEGTP